MKLCCVFNCCAHYHFPVIEEIDKQFLPDFYFGIIEGSSIKEFDPNKLNGFKNRLPLKPIGFHGFTSYRGMKKILKREYTHYLLTGEVGIISNLFILLYAKLTGKKVYLWTHGIYHRAKGREKLVMKFFYGLADGLLVYANHNAKYVAELSKKCSSRIHIFHNSLDTNKQTLIYKSLSPTNIYYSKFGNTNPTFIYIGRIQRRKKVDQIIYALSNLKKQGKNYNLVIVGSYSDEDSFDPMVEELDLIDNIWLYGPCYDEAINGELLYNACACVSPGNVGLTSIHALTYGTPVISHNDFDNQMPEFEAIEEGVTGSFFEINNIDDLADKMEYWATISKEQRDIARNAARKTIENEWSVDYQINVLKEVLSDAGKH